MAKMLLVWENIPDNTDLYELENGSEMADWAERSAGLYINAGDIAGDHPIHKLNEWLNTPEGRATKIEGLFAAGPYDYVAVCGFMM